MRCLHRLSHLFVTPPPWLTLLVGVILGGVLTSTFTFHLWWCSYGDVRLERETIKYAQFHEQLRDFTNTALTDSSSHPKSDCLCGAELKRLRDSIPAVSKAAILPPSEKPSVHILARPEKENKFVPLNVEKPVNESKTINYLHPPYTSKELLNASSLNKEPVQYLGHEFHFRKQLLVAVVTSGSHLHSASTVYDTWGADANQVIFFVGKDCNATSPYLRGLPLVRLPNVPDLPVNSVAKSFSVLKYVSDNYKNDFQWFLLANDNLYVHTDRLSNLLKQMDPSEKIYLGRAARGKDEEANKLSLLPHEHYCLGSSGVVLSYELLQALSTRLEFCLNAALSSLERDRERGGGRLSGHADVELGRCISRQIGVQCSQAMQVMNGVLGKERGRAGVYGHVDLIYKINNDGY